MYQNHNETLVWLVIFGFYCISPLFNIYYISRQAKTEKGKRLTKTIGGAIYAASIFLIIVGFIAVMYDVKSVEIFFEAVISLWIPAVILVSPIINIIFRVKNAAALSMKILFGGIGIVSYFLFLFLLYRFFVISYTIS